MADDEWMKLSVEEQCIHKVWKARLHGYEQVIKLFQSQTDEKSPEFSKFAGLLKKFAIDSNAVAQEKGLDAILAFLENAALAPKTCGEVCSGVVTKCLNSSRTKTKEKGKEILMVYIELEKQEQVMEEVIKGLTNKQPKIVTACASVLKDSVNDFGTKIISVKPIVKSVPKLLEHSDKNVREEAKQLAIALYKWIGAALKPSLQHIKPVQLKELEDEFENLPKKAAKQSRFLKSQQDLKAKAERAAAAGDDGEEDSEEEEDAAVAVDPFELLSAQEILSRIPKDFYENMEAKKWQTRKEALEGLQPLVTLPKLEAGDYAELVRVLKKTISKDNNVMIVAQAAKCMAGLANGLRKKFSPYAAVCIPAILEKFKEKKMMVVTALREAIDAVFPSAQFPNIIEDIVASLENKNPSIKTETAKFLIRAFRVSLPSALPKNVLKPLCATLVKRLTDTVSDVRESAMEALGTALRIMGEKPMGPFLNELETIKLAKIKEYCDKVELPEGRGGASKKKEKKAEPKEQEEKKVEARPKSAPSGSKKVAKPKPGGAKPGGAKAVKGGGGAKGKATKKVKGGGDTEEKAEPHLSSEEVDERAANALPKAVIDPLGSANWKERLAAMEEFKTKVHNMEAKDIEAQVFVRVLAKPPGFKEVNFQVMIAKFTMIATLAEKANFSKTSASYVIKPLVDKIGDVKGGPKAKEALTMIAEKCTLGYVAEAAATYAFDGQKNPKNQAETCNWLSQAIQEFGFSSINAKVFIGFIKKGLSATNPQIRTASISMAGVMHMYMGSAFRALFEDLKPALLTMLDAEFEKVAGQKPPVPFRGLKKGGGAEEDDEDDDDEDEEGADASPVNLQDLVDRVDISSKITEGLIAELADSKWKVRGEALEKVQTILKEANFITPNMGDLPTALKGRLAESNKLLATTTANICQTIATAVGPPIKTHVNKLVPGLFVLTADSKPSVREAAINALSAWEEQIGMAPFIDDEILSTALSKEKPVLRMEVLGWLAVRLAKHRSVPADLAMSVPYLYIALEDRNGDVRKKAQEALPVFMMHLTYEKMVKMTGKLKPASKSTVLGILEKQRANIPEKPGKPASKKTGKKAASKPAAEEAAPEPAEPAPVKREMKRPKTAPSKSSKPDSSSSASNNAQSSESESSVSAPPATKKGTKAKPDTAGGKSKVSKSKKKDDDDDDGSPALILGVSKERRIKEEQDFKVLKWNFTAARSEYVDQLKDQMQGNVNKSLMTNLFHDDFKKHVAAIATLTDVIDSLKDATIGNLDLILKWYTLRFFETNTAVHVKSLDYLQQLLTMLAEEDYSLLDQEANSFIPYLLVKIGDNKENIRKGVRKCLKLLGKLYPASKLFSFVMDGLKSKNARQRTECLEELGSLIELYGLNVCQPSPPKALKEIASQIADRDNSVRSAALNTLVQAYLLVGEDLYKQVGKLNDKDLGLLEERIKRASKKAANAPKTAAPVAAPASQPAAKKAAESRSKLDPKKSSILNRPATAPASNHSQKSDPNHPAHFSLDLDKLGLGSATSGVKLPELIDNKAVEELLGESVVIPIRSAPKISMPSEMQLNFMMSQVASHDFNISIQALAQLDEILKDRERSKIMVLNVDQLLWEALLQLRMTFSKTLADEESSKDVIRMYRCVVALLVSLFQNPQLSINASKDRLCDLVNGLITVLLDDRLMKFEEGPQVVRSVNVLMAKVVENADHSNIISALLKLLHECVALENNSMKFLQLVMKCLWRMVRRMPNIINDLQVDKIILDLHNFLKAFPSSTWKDKPCDTPLRTVKTMLHSFAKILGPKVLLHLHLIPDPKESEVEMYLKKVLRSSQRPSSSSSSSNEHLNGTASDTEKANIQVPVHRTSPRRSSGNTNDVLAKIFKKIGSKENTREGLSELYDFKQRYPDVDIDPFLKKTSHFFQTYIEHGLNNITKERESSEKTLSMGSQGSTPSPSTDSQISPADIGGDPESSTYLERIRVLRAKCGFQNDPGNVPEVLKMPIKQEHAMADSRDPLISLGSSSTSAPSTNRPQVPDTNMEDLKKRLERVKKEQQK